MRLLRRRTSLQGMTEGGQAASLSRSDRDRPLGGTSHFCARCCLAVLFAIVLSILMMSLPQSGTLHAATRLRRQHMSNGSAQNSQGSNTISPGSNVAGTSAAVDDSDLEYLRSKKLLIPVAGIGLNQLRDSFDGSRSEGRRHQAIDIMSPALTPVLATTDGTIVRLFQNVKGGTTVYQLDSSGAFIFYYAHLSSYAEGVGVGSEVHRGDVIAYVGDSGNAGAGNFHLHFAIWKVTARSKWSGGTPINPYPLLAARLLRHAVR